MKTIITILLLFVSMICLSQNISMKKELTEEIILPTIDSLKSKTIPHFTMWKKDVCVEDIKDSIRIEGKKEDEIKIVKLKNEKDK